MAISVSKKKPKALKKVEPKKCCSTLTSFVRFVYKVPIAISVLLLIYLWSSSSTIISGKIVHVCISSRKLNSLYCLSAGTQPNFEIPIPSLENGTEIQAPTVENGSSSGQSLVDQFGDNGTIGSPVITNLVLEKEISISPIVVDDDDNNNITGSPIVNLELVNEIQSSPINDNSTTLSPIVNLDLEKEIQSSPIVDNNTSLSPNITLELEKEITIPIPTNLEVSTSNDDNGTISNPIINLEVKKEVPTQIDDNSTIVVSHGVTNLEVQSPIDDNVTTSNSNSTIILELKKEVPNQIDDNSTNVVNSLITNLELQSSQFVDNSSTANERNYKQAQLTPNQNDTEVALEAAESYMKDLRSWTANKTREESCEGRGIFVYNLPEKFNVDLVGQCNEMVPWIDFCGYLSNGGLGEPIRSLGRAWHRTHMYSLEPISHSRALNHPCRVQDESKAKLFYVPFYGGLDVLRWHFKNVSNEVKDSLGLDVIKWLESQPSWKRNSGKDHVFVLGKISWDFRREQGRSWGTSFLELPEMQTPAKVLIERQPWHENDIGVPHPTYFHPRSDDDVTAWQTKIIASPRRHLACFAGAARPKSPENIRNALMRQCEANSGDETCRILKCNSGKGCGEPEDLVNLFSESEFCFQPPGDSPTRRSVFDSLVSGCIPVIFDPFTVHYQYPWHLPEDHRKYSVFIDQREVREKGLDVIERLKGISKEERDDMRRFIVYELLPGLVYGDPESKLVNFRDAFTITIDSLVDRVNSLLLSSS